MTRPKKRTGVHESRTSRSRLKSAAGKHAFPPTTDTAAPSVPVSSPHSSTVSSERHVFLSYSRADRQYVSALATWLESHGVSVWYDHDIEYGAKWQAALENELESARTVLVVMSVAARASKWVDRELAHARKRQVRILPVLLESEGMLARIADLQFENVIGGRMPGLAFCQKLPGFLVSEDDISSALTPPQREVAGRIFSSVGPLRRGSKGPGVAVLQGELIRVGLDPGPVDGIFGARTATAVREFQRRRCHKGLVDVMVGPRIWAILVNSALGDLAPSETRE